ncbi:hypothetical protein PPTG_10592 [Phytophthora nicotianae INRA-310]|uniref:Uncharacterized protein n=1 Tax=Phytophthora nicotianae (strain INRA-310) TaxID=761204 RepID=W2QD56_PHYN3|nr:hypothetical protein PPTG_10592 [Phytophthora nicotianae INRA-310]ETN10459.1 hypothetical protein PPTG_10592 [Phytophthora nicotianae INRA-310]
MAVPPASAAAAATASPASAASSLRSPTVRPGVLPSDSLVAPTGMASPASPEPHTLDEEFLASFLDWGPDSDFGSHAHARSRARSSTPPAPTEISAVPDAMVDALAVAVTLP